MAWQKGGTRQRANVPPQPNGQHNQCRSNGDEDIPKQQNAKIRKKYQASENGKAGYPHKALGKTPKPDGPGRKSAARFIRSSKNRHKIRMAENGSSYLPPEQIFMRKIIQTCFLMNPVPKFQTYPHSA